MEYKHARVPASGSRISIQDGKLQVPDNPILPFIEGDGTGRDIWRASVRVFDAAVAKAYGVWTERTRGDRTFMGIDRVTFAIDEGGQIAEIWKVSDSEAHGQEVLDWLKTRS